MISKINLIQKAYRDYRLPVNRCYKVMKNIPFKFEREYGHKYDLKASECQRPSCLIGASEKFWECAKVAPPLC